MPTYKWFTLQVNGKETEPTMHDLSECFDTNKILLLNYRAKSKN